MRANQLTYFFNRYNHPNSVLPQNTAPPTTPTPLPSLSHPPLMRQYKHRGECPPTHEHGSSGVQTQQSSGSRWRTFWNTKERKSFGPDGFGGRIVKNYAEQLANIFCFIFSASVELHRVPGIWKDSVVVPVPKIINDYRPVALTSLIIKTFEK